MLALLRSLWAEPRPPGAPGRSWGDRGLSAVMAAAILVEGLLRTELPHRWLSIGLGLAVAPLLMWRRAHPLAVVLAVFGAATAVALATWGATPQQSSMVLVLVLPFALFRWGSGREAAAGAAFLAVVVPLCTWLAADRSRLGDVLGGFGVVLASMALGAATRYRAADRLRELDRAVLLERERLARDLHDTVAHHVSAIAVRAQAGLATGATEDALQVIEAEATRTLGEMRSMVRVLRRDEGAELAPAPGLTELRGLAGGPGSPPVQVEITGATEDLPPSVASALYRLAQESVTNARRHARDATRIAVRVDADHRRVRLHVDDDGHAPAAAGGGYGLTGMAERARLLGGTCVAGPGPGRGWTVTAELPIGAP